MTGIIEGVAAALSVTFATAQIIVSTVVGLLVSALSMGLQALMRPTMDSPSSPRAQLQNTVKDPTKAREIVIGKVRKGGTIVFIDTVNNDEYLLMAVALAGHEVQAIDEIYFYEDLAIDQAGNIQKKFKGALQFEKHLGTDSQAASPLLIQHIPKWTAAHQLKGIAYIVLRLRFDTEIYNTIPNVTAVVRGAKIFDTRDSVTRYSTNAALATAFYLNHPTYGLGAAYGTDIDNTVLNAAANESDEDVPIKAGKTLEFDGSNDFINIGDTLDQTGSFSIEARVRPGVVNRSGMKVLDKQNGTVSGFSLQIENDKVRFVTRGLSNVTLDTAAGQMAAGTWKHIAAVYDAAAGTKKIYVNGAEVASATGITGSLAANSQALRIGDNFKGRIQDVRLWNDPRSSTEVAAFDDKTLVGTETNLVGYWPLNEKRDRIAEDATETPNDGKIDGAVWVADTSVLGTEKRYTTNGVFFSDQLPREIVGDLLTAMGGSIVHSGGLWLIRAAAYETPTVTLTENDAREGLRIQPARSRRELFNSVRGTFAAPENKYQQSDFPLLTNAGFETQDGGERITQDIVLPFTTSSSTAQRIAMLHLLRNREQLSCTFKAKLSALALRAGDTVAVTNTRMGWSSKVFEVVTWGLVQVEDIDGNLGIGVDMELREIAAAVFDWNALTDEVPLNASPNTNLPSPFRQMAITSAFIERTGFTTIKERDHEYNWSGTAVGMVRNPWKGSLEVDDQIGAAGNNFDVFDQFVQTPVAHAYYETLEEDIEFDDTIRTYVEYSLDQGSGETGSFGFEVKVDEKVDGGAYDGEYQSVLSPVVLTARYFKHRIDLDFSAGHGGFLQNFHVTIDKTTQFLRGSNVAIPVGGKDFVFETPFHNLPSMGYSVKESARTVQFPATTKTGFNAVVFDNSAADVGGTIDWQATGV